MTEQTRYRLIGTIFLVAVAAVALPMLFDGEGVAPMQLDPLPPAEFDVAPDLSPPPDMTPALEARRELIEEIDADGFARDTGTRVGEPVLLEEPADEAPAIAAAGDASPQPGDPAGEPSRPAPAPAAGEASAQQPESPQQPELKWAVQVASFAQAANATALRDQLVGDGYTAFLSNVKRDGQVITRVAVGPFIDRADAASEKDELDRRYDVQAAIVRFTY